MLVTTKEPHMVFLFVCARALNVSIVSECEREQLIKMSNSRINENIRF